MPLDNPTEWFDLVNEQGHVIGRATRAQCHSDPTLIHPVVHVVVRDREGRVLLQRRSLKKDTQPGVWDTSVGGHLQPGEDPLAAARREMREELGVEPGELQPLYHYVWRCPRETEFVRAFGTVHEGPFRPDPDEVDEVRFWSAGEIEAKLGEGSPFTPNFRHEWVQFNRAR
jgi:isopentenyl-diphosphate delta-isomerase type 1